MSPLDQVIAERRRGLRLFWLLADQAIYAGSNFATNIVFARWLPVFEYGLYSISFTVFLFLCVIHYGVFLEPLLIQSAQIQSEYRRSYIVAMAKLHVLLVLGMAALSIFGYLTTKSLGYNNAAWVMLGAGIGGTMILVLLTARRLCLVFLSPITSALTGAIYCLGVFGTVYTLHAMQDIFWGDLWLIMGSWSLICSSVIFFLLYFNTFGTRIYSLSDIYRLQRKYVGWSLAASIGAWFAFESILVVLARLSGLESVAVSRAIINLTNPLMQTINAMQASWLVLFSAAYGEGRRYSINNLLAIFSLAILASTALLFIIAKPLIEIVYAGKYLDHPWELPIYWLGLGFQGIDYILSTDFKARGLLKQGYVSQIWSAFFGLGAALVLIPLYGQPGAIVAIVLTYFVAMCLVAVFRKMEFKG